MFFPVGYYQILLFTFLFVLYTTNMMQKEFVVVFGATGGIGKALVQTLIDQDKNVIAVARNSQKLQDLSNEMPIHSYYDVDITQRPLVDAFFKAVSDKEITIDGVAHCVGSIVLKPLQILKDEEFLECLNLNLTSVLYVMRASVKQWLNKKVCGHFVACSTGAASIGLPNHEAIAAAKSGLEGLVRSAAATYANKNIFINAVAPGLVETNLSAMLTKSEASLAASLDLHGIKRLGKPQDIASALAWLLDKKQSWISGQIIKVDGGLSGMKVKS